jgi:hypothetical protein
MSATPSPLVAWQSFYVIVGSSAGALTGLQFVVLTLVTEAGMLRSEGEALSAFASPNIVHFCAALLVSALFSAPWSGLGAPGVAVALCGLGGLVYSVMVLGIALRQKEYKPVLEDWIWHAVLPMLAYAALVHSGWALRRESPDTLYVIGAALLLLLFIGIHNAWDTVTYVTLERAKAAKASKAAAAAALASTPSATPPASH